MKCVNTLIEHFGYDYEERREIMEYISDCTFLVNKFEKVSGLRTGSEYKWSMYCCHYQPPEVIKAFGIPQKGTKQLFYPCRECSRKNSGTHTWEKNTGLHEYFRLRIHEFAFGEENNTKHFQHGESYKIKNG